MIILSSTFNVVSIPNLVLISFSHAVHTYGVLGVKH